MYLLCFGVWRNPVIGFRCCQGYYPKPIFDNEYSKRQNLSLKPNIDI